MKSRLALPDSTVLKPPNGGASFCNPSSADLRNSGSFASVARLVTDFASTPARCFAQPDPVIAWAIWLTLKYFQWRMTYFVVTSRRVIYRTGVVSKHGVEIPLERINTVFFNQSILERMIGAGDLGIESAGERGMETFENVRKPSLVQNEIYRQMEANNQRMYGSMHQAAAPAQLPH